MLETSDAWLMSRSSHRPSDPAYYIEDCRIYGRIKGKYAGCLHEISSGYPLCQVGRNAMYRVKSTHDYPHVASRLVGARLVAS